MNSFRGIGCALLFILAIHPLHAQERAYKSIDGKWNKLDAAEWPRPKSDKGKVTIKTGGQITFNVTYLDVANSTGVGFDDPTHGAARRSVIAEVFAYLNAVLDENGTCDVEFSASETDGTGALAHASTFYGDSETFTTGDAFVHIVSGNDPANTFPDITATVDFGHDWFASTETNIPFEQYDLYSVLLHEVTHGLGVSSMISSTGASEIFPNVYSTWDRYLVTAGGTTLLSPTGVFQVPVGALTGGEGAVRFQAPVTSVVFGADVPIFTPTTFQPGSSMSHFSSAIFPPPVMSPSIGNGQLKRTFQPLEVAALTDLFYRLRGEPVADAGNWTAYR